MPYIARVYVTPRQGVNDPQGLAILGGLHNLGYSAVSRVRAGKYLEIRIAEAASVAAAEAQVREMCRQLLANPNTEDFRFEVEEG